MNNSNKKIGFIGCGHMASAIIKGMIDSGRYDRECIMASAAHKKDVFGIHCITDNIEIAKKSDVLVIAVRPNIIKNVAKEIKDYIIEDASIVSVAAFISLKELQEMFGANIKIARAMPNGPVCVGEGMTAICGDVSAEIVDIFESCGCCEVVKEELLDDVIAVSGSSPAYVYMFIEAMANKATELGMPYEQALKFATQAVLGSAKLVKDSDELPAELINKICTPNGTTIEAVNTLKTRNFEEIIKDAMQSCFDKAQNGQF